MKGTTKVKAHRSGDRVPSHVDTSKVGDRDIRNMHAVRAADAALYRAQRVAVNTPENMERYAREIFTRCSVADCHSRGIYLTNKKGRFHCSKHRDTKEGA